MFEAWDGGDDNFGETAVRAVVAYLRSKDCRHGEDSSDTYADVIEREFLVPK